MKAGETLSFLTTLNNNGSPISVADAPAFQALGYALVIYENGAIVTPAYTVTDLGFSDGRHRIAFVVNEADYEIFITEPVNYTADPNTGQAFIDSVELSDIYAAVNNGTDLVPIQQNLGDQSLGNLVEGDAFHTGTLTVPLSRLTPYGFSDLTDMTISAAFRDGPEGTPLPITATIEDIGNREVSAEQIAFLGAMALATGVTEYTWYLDIQLKHTPTSTIITVGRYSLKVIWQRDETT